MSDTTPAAATTGTLTPTPNRRPLEELSLAELEELQLGLKRTVTDIQLQQRPAPDDPENGAAWSEFLAWRGRANGTLKTTRRRLAAIREERRKRQRAAETRRGTRHPDAESIRDRRARPTRDLEDGDPSALLLDASRVIQRLLRTIEGLPEVLDERDHDTLTRLSIYLKDRYGRGPVEHYLRH